MGPAAGRGRHRLLGLFSWLMSNRSFSTAASYFHKTKLSEGNLRVNGWGCTGPVLERSRRSGPAPQRPRRAGAGCLGLPAPPSPLLCPPPSSEHKHRMSVPAGEVHQAPKPPPGHSHPAPDTGRGPQAARLEFLPPASSPHSGAR